MNILLCGYKNKWTYLWLKILVLGRKWNLLKVSGSRSWLLPLVLNWDLELGSTEKPFELLARSTLGFVGLEIIQRNTIVGIMSILLCQNMVLKVLYFGELLYNIDIVNVIFIVTSTHVNLLKKLSLYHKNTR